MKNLPSNVGQPSPTLSSGEAQRIKLATELSKVRDDITRWGQKAPHTLVMAEADWIIDLGPVLARG